MTSLNIAIIGAGGVASYMLPALCRTFDISGHIIDADVLEKHNLNRQIFNERDVGRGKAEALVRFTNTPLEPVRQWLKESSLEENPEWFQDVDFIVAVVDNHEARRNALAAAARFGCGLFIGANEYETSQVIYWHPRMGDTWSPLTRYPTMATSMEGSPMDCTSDDAIESAPQLAIANQVTAALVNYMIWQWYGPDGFFSMSDNGRDFEPHWPIEHQTTLGAMETIKMGDL
jgi:hypothetical protein